MNLWIKISDIFVLFNFFFTSCEILERGFVMFGTKNWTCTYVWNSDPLSIVLNYEESSHMWEKVLLFSFTLSYELCSHYNSILQISTYVKLNMYTYVVYTYPHIPFKWISNTLIKRIWQFLGTIILKLWIDSKSSTSPLKSKRRS